MSTNNLGLTLEQSVTSRRFGQWRGFHRISGLAVLLFLTVHIVDNSFVYFPSTVRRSAQTLRLFRLVLARSC
jgi:succinate dehydrogenase/fumarate reductase cytochrome b subunit